MTATDVYQLHIALYGSIRRLRIPLQ